MGQRAGLNPPEPGPPDSLVRVIRLSGRSARSSVSGIVDHVPLKFRSCEMCDALIVVDSSADRGFCSTECRERHDRLANELDRTMTRLSKSLRALRDLEAS